MPEATQSRADLARELLRYKMMEYSQGGFCASWLVDLEFELWTEADRSDCLTERDYIHSTSRECRMLAEIAGGWWAWDYDPKSTENPVFLPMERWLQRLTAHEAAQPTSFEDTPP